jgi:hypothetical protein
MSDGDQGSVVYVIGGQTGAQKIGISVAPSQRVATMQVYSPVKLVVHHRTDPSGDARLVERVAHQLLAEKRLHGEWFDVQIEEAVTAVKRAIQLVDAGDLGILEPERGPVTLMISRELLEQIDAALHYWPPR